MKFIYCSTGSTFADLKLDICYSLLFLAFSHFIIYSCIGNCQIMLREDICELRKKSEKSLQKEIVD